jgi:predicted metal-dependent HD superfamily phosphohydrolase
MKSLERFEEERLNSIAGVVGVMMPNLPYHNFPDHVVDVFEAVMMYGTFEEVSPGSLYVLRASALVHDAVFEVGASDNEEQTAKFVESFFPKLMYSDEQVKLAARLTRVTDLRKEPQDLLEQIIRDADLDNLGRDDFLECNRRVALELGLPLDKKWYENSLSFLEKHRYYTKSAQRIRNAGKEANKDSLRYLIASFN